MDTSEIITAFVQGVGRWKGCCWPTEFGDRKLNLDGLKSSHAELMAGATSGSERASWRGAATWLQRVEEDAGEAEKRAELAAKLAVLGDLDRARAYAEEACVLESRYTADQTWRPLLIAITKVLDSVDHNGHPH
ncbi:MAG: hypothetical protein ACT4QC_15365 [Planctomycetaceae bacterium]